MSKDTLIGPNTKIQLTTVITVLASVVWLTGELRSIKEELAAARILVDTKVSLADFRLWTARFKLGNPTLKLPDLMTGKEEP